MPLVSGAAIASAGQWGVYGGINRVASLENSASEQALSKRPCYRCMWPRILPGSSGRCDEVGVWGVCTGMVGVGMAGEVIKLILGNEGEWSGWWNGG